MNYFKNPKNAHFLKITAINLNLKEFKLGESLGRGAYGEVFHCTNLKTKKQYAAKVSNIMPKKDMEHYFTREINSLSHINHPCVIKLAGYSKTSFDGQERPVLLTEYMNGGSLKKAIDFEFGRSPISNWNNTKKQIILIGMTAGLKALHEKHIIHRDFKPDNILLDSALSPHIIDFGMSKILDPGSTINMSMYGGTVSYMAPEIFDGGDFAYPVDMYAYGVTVYELICGRPAYDKRFVMGKIMNNVVAGIRPKFIHLKCPDEFEKFIDNCWCQAPESRLTAEEAYNELMTNENLILPNVDIDEVRSYCNEFLSEIPKSVQNAKRGKGGFHLRPTGPDSKASSFSQTTKPKLDQAGVPTISVKIPTKKTKRSSAKVSSTRKEPEESSSSSSSSNFARFSSSLDPSMMKRFSDSSFISSLNTTMKNTVLKEDSELITSTINSTKTDDFSLTTSISSSSSLFNKIKILAEPDPDMPADLLFLIGNMYEFGSSKKGMNFTRAAAFYKAAADKGHASAMFNYGNFLRDGVGVEEDHVAAVNYLTKAANAGCLEATVNLGRMIEEGDGCEKDVRKALEWYEKGAKEGEALGYFHAGRLYFHGDKEGGLEPNYSKAEKYLKKASEKDDGFGPRILLASLYYTTDKYDEGIPYAKSLADEDVGPAQFLYALMIKDKNGKEAVEYLERAAGNGFNIAMWVLANMYFRGDGIKEDKVKGAKWFKNSADSGDPDGAMRYGMCLIDGEGVEADPEEGARYIREVAKSGNMKAAGLLAFLGVVLEKIKLIEEDNEFILKGLLFLATIDLS